MARPESFNNVKIKEPDNPQQEGKVFESRMYASLRKLGGWTARFADIVNVDASGNMRKISAVSPPDYIHCNDRFNFLVECKTLKVPDDKRTGRFDFSRVDPHQIEDLIQFDAVSKSHTGILAILIYNTAKGKDRTYRCFMIPISVWTSIVNNLCGSRKSMPAEYFDLLLFRFEVEYNKRFLITTQVIHTIQRGEDEWNQ